MPFGRESWGDQKICIILLSHVQVTNAFRQGVLGGPLGI